VAIPPAARQRTLGGRWSQYVVSLQFTGGATTLRATFPRRPSNGVGRATAPGRCSSSTTTAPRPRRSGDRGSLDELDRWPRTVSVSTSTLVTVLQDFSQLKARWGPRASTIVNNHTNPFVLGGLADPTASPVSSRALETRKDAPPLVPLRQRPPERHRDRRSPTAFSVRLQPWWRDRRLRVEGCVSTN